MGDSKLTPDLAETEADGGADGGKSGPEWRVGLRLADRYVLRRFLGKGGMGQVWLAFDEVLDKEVALKRVRADVVRASDALESLRREVSLAQTVTHVNVCRIYDLEPLGSDWVIKMEVVGGRSLGAVLEETPALPVARALHIAQQLADGLAAVHAVGVVHRDLKPHNVLLDDGGRAVLMDFGIARATAATGDTAAGRITGTPEYMAPEQARGEKVDARADLYALGCVLYRMLAGEVPFPAATRVAAMARHLTDPPPDARKRRPEVPAWLAQLARDLMAKSADKRPRDARAVRARLAGPPSRAPRIAALAAAALVVGAGAAAGVTAWREHLRDRWRPVYAELPAEYDARAKPSLPSPDGTLVAFQTRRNDDVRVMVGPVAAAGKLTTGPAGYRLLNWTHDGRALLLADKSDHLVRFPLDGGPLEPLGIEAVGAADCDALFTVEPVPALCADCARLVVHRRDQPPRELVPADTHRYVSELVACDGDRVAYTRYDLSERRDHLFVRAADAAAPTEVTDIGGHQFIKLGSFTDRGTLVVNALDGKTTNVWELPIGAGHARQLGFGGDEFLPKVTRDGRLFFEIIRSTSALYARPEGKSAARVTFGDESITGLTPTPDGRAVVLTIKRAYAGAEQLVLHPLDDGPEEVLDHAGDAGNLMLAPAFAGDDLYYQVMPAGAMRAPLMAWSLREHRSRKVRELPEGFLSAVVDGVVHLATDRGAVRVPVVDDGSAPVADGPKPWGAIVPAAHGGWRAAFRYDQAPAAALFAPGAPLDGTPAFTLPTYPLFIDDGRAILFGRGGTIVRRDLASAKETVLAEPGEVGGVALTPDGKTLLYTKPEEYARRLVMTNFTDRPPL